MNYIKSLLAVFTSYFFSHNINLPIKINVLKNDKLRNNLPIWQVVENENYSKSRSKNLGGISFETGLKYTLDFIKNKDISDNFNKILVISAKNVDEVLFEADYDLFDVVIAISNVGLDLGAHKNALKFFYNQYCSINSDILILSNSSFRPQHYCFSMKFLSLSLQAKVLLGISYGYGPRYYLLKKYHIQSFFLASSIKFMQQIFSDIDLRTNNKYYVIRHGELKITDLVYRNSGLSICYDSNNFIISDHPQWQFAFYDHRLN